MRLSSLFASITLLSCVTAAPKKPMIHETSFDHLPRKFSYFEDSSTILFFDERSGVVHRSSDDGTTWSKAADVPEQLAQMLILHPFDNDVAFILGPEKEHYRTVDQGKTWQKFQTEASPSLLQAPLSFNAKDHDLIIFAGEHCDDKGGFWGTHCYDHSYYTDDGFKTRPTLLRENTHSCIFARSTKAFKDAPTNLVLCIDEENQSNRKFPMNLRLVTTTDWYKTEKEVTDDAGPIRGVVGLGAVQTFIVAATKAPGTDEMALYVTDDGFTWDLAEFPHDHEGLKEDAYTILESRPYGIQVDVMSSEIQYNSFGTLFMSNSNGTYFTKNLDYTNRNELGIVDFENVENIEGIVMANVVLNHQEVQKNRNTAKVIQSRISFNDGRTWQPLTAPEDAECNSKDAENCSLHLYSAAAPHNVGRIFSSTTPGVLMGVGSVGTSLLPYSECDLYISEDAGASWRMSKKDAHKYEWGDQGGILVAVYDEDTTDKLYYSFNRGIDWESIDLGMKVRARILTTVPDSTTEKFTLVASRGKGEDSEANVHVFSIDFTGIRSRKCKINKDNSKKSDFDKWYGRYTEKGEPACLMGHKQFFWRKKLDSDCYVGDIYHEPEAKEEDCPCQEHDFECDYNFVKQDDKCVPASKSIFSKQCANGEKTFTGSSGYRLIPGNTCDRKKGLSLDEKIERSCEEDSAPPADGQITAKVNDFDGHARQYFYLERSENASGDDETVIMQIDIENVYKSHNQGTSWEQILEDEEIVAIVPHKYFSDWIYFLTASKTAFVSKDRGKTIREIELPSAPNNMGRAILDFHSTRSSWLLFTGLKGCERSSKEDCRAATFYTEDGGSSWDLLHDHVDTCQYIGATKVEADANLIYCTAWSGKADHSGDLHLFSSIDYFESSEKIFESIVGFAVFEEFVIVAEVFEDAYLRFHASVDGKVFALGHFPPKFSVEQQQAYTVLDSVTKSIFLHVTTNPQPGSEWGSILKSNSNGTYFVTSLDFVNRNTAGYVDFEKLMGLEGVAIVNVVTNDADVKDGAQKKLRTKMTHNDGGEWSYLAPPAKDTAGKQYDCSSGDLDKCSLNLHGYTERVDVRDTYSSGSAIGILLGVGNVGDYLIDYEASNTFMSNDGGITWQESHKGPYQWEFGDQGSIVVIVKDGEATDRVLYTLDEGKSWIEYIFAGEKMIIRDITTVPSDSSRKFLLFAKPDVPGDKMKTITLDFSGLTDKQCDWTDQDDKNNDFYPWIPTHPSNEDQCLFGHVTQYYRKKPDKTCYVGPKLDTAHKVLKNCTCSIYDYECDYNYQRASDRTCQLIPGLSPPDHSAICTQSNVTFWTEPTGYRRVPLTTCVQGKALDDGIEHPCPGHEQEYRRSRKGLHGFWLFVVVCIPFTLAGVIGYYVWNLNGGRTLGQIRLGDDSLDQNIASTRDKAQEYTVLVLSGLLTAIIAIPTVAKFLWTAGVARFGGLRSRPAYYEALDHDPLLSDDEDPLDEDI